MSRSLALILLISAALGSIAQGQSRDETRLPQNAWQALEGQWAERGACDEPLAVWVFSPSFIEMGRLTCDGIGKVTWDEDAVANTDAWRDFVDSTTSAALTVPLSICRADAAELPDFSISLLPLSADRIIAQIPDQPVVPLSPCIPK